MNDISNLSAESIRLAAAITLPDYTERRKALRKLALPPFKRVLERDVDFRQRVREAIDARNAANGTNINHRASAFIEMLHEDALILIAALDVPREEAVVNGSSWWGWSNKDRRNAERSVCGWAVKAFGADPCGIADGDRSMAESRRNAARFIAVHHPNLHETLMKDDSNVTDNANDATPAQPVATIDFTPVHANMANILNAIMAQVQLPPVEQIIQRHNEAVQREATLAAEVENLRKSLANRPATAAIAVPQAVVGQRVIPSGRTVTKRAADLFGQPANPMLAFDVTAFEWDGPHPDVPAVDPNYIFREKQLVRLLYALVHNNNPWVWGPTGTGKTTLIMQVAARLGWPVIRVNFDDEVDRAALIGKQDLTVDATTGQTITTWTDGALPTAIAGPYIFVADELDRIRPATGYVFQPVLEGNGIVLAEDGGRHVAPHPMHRIVATANTNGGVDETGMYAGARPQSAAFMNRFRTVIEVPYLDAVQERALIKAACPAMPDTVLDQVMSYVSEHRRAFSGGEVTMPLSPRNTVSMAEAYLFFAPLYGVNESEADTGKGANRNEAREMRRIALNEALDMTVLGLASSADRVVLSGLASRTFAG